MNRILYYLYNTIETDGSILMGLIDPDKHYGQKGAELAFNMEKGGADAILVGGSTGSEGEIISYTIKCIKRKVNIPVIIFPGNAGAVSRYADAIYYLNIKNTTSSYWGLEFPFLMTPLIKKAAIEPIPVAYMIIEPGQTAGWISHAYPFPRQKPDLAVIGALSAEFAGAKIVVMDAGSGSNLDIPYELISRISNEIKIPLIYAGGIKIPEQAFTAIQKGASGIQVGTAAEKSDSVIDLFKNLKEAMRDGYNNRNLLSSISYVQVEC